MASFETSDSCISCDFMKYCMREYPDADPSCIFNAKGSSSCNNWTNCSPKNGNYTIEIDAIFNKLKNHYLCVGRKNWEANANIVYSPIIDINTYMVHLLISPKLTVLIETKIGEQKELTWLRSDLAKIWSYNAQSGFNAVSFEKYASKGLSVFGSQQKQSYLVRVLIEPSINDLERYNLLDLWVALSHHMVKRNIPYRAMDMAA